MKHKALLTALSILTAYGCGGDNSGGPGTDSGSFNGKLYHFLEGSELDSTGAQISGTGSVVFQSPLAQIQSQYNFFLAFSVEDGGSLELITHADKALANGVGVLFERHEGELSTTLRADGSGTVSKVLPGIDASVPITLSVDVHNNETPAHVLIGNEANSIIYDSEVDEATPGAGQGKIWGLVLQKVILTSAIRQDPKFSEE